MNYNGCNPALTPEGNNIVREYAKCEVIGQAGKTPLLRYTLPDGKRYTMVKQIGERTSEAKCFLKNEKGDTVWATLWPTLKK